MHNPSSETYGPLTYNMIVYTRKGLIQTSYLHASRSDRRRWPACCAVSVSAGRTASVRLPTQRYAVGYVRLVDIRTFWGGEARLVPAEVECELVTMTCETVAVSQA